MVEEYRLELAKRSPIELDLDVSLAWITICWIHETVLISKKFWFINRLVENDKINRDRILKENWQFRMFYYDLERVKNYDRLTMYLSVENNPIDFLISILK